MRFRGLIEALSVALGALALTCLFTYPLAFNLGSVGRVNTDDGRWSIWVVSWVAYALTTDPAGVYQANIFYPHRNALAFSESNLVAGALGAPVWLATRNPYATHNIVVLISFVVAFAGAYYLVRYLTGSRPAAVVAGILFAFCPFIFARTAHIQLMLTGGLPFCLLALHRLVDRATVSRAATLGVALWLQALACAYYGIFAALAVGFGTLFFAQSRSLWRNREYWIGIGLAAFVSVALTVPFFLPYLRVQRETGFARPLDESFSADLGAWLASSAWAHSWWLPFIEPWDEVLFPGIVVTGLAAYGTWRSVSGSRKPQTGPAPPKPFSGEGGTREHGPDTDRELSIFYLATALIGIWVSFGPSAGLYIVLYHTLPVFSFLRAPARIGILVTMCLVVLGTIGLAHLLKHQRRAGLLAAAVGVLAIADLIQAPLTALRQAEPLPAAYRTLAIQPPGAVVEFPYFYRRSDFPRHAIYMLNSTSHWMPLVNGYSDHIPQDFRDHVVPLSSFPTRDSFFILGKIGARYAVFHLDLYDRRSRERVIERIAEYGQYLGPLVKEGDVWVFEIVGWPN